MRRKRNLEERLAACLDVCGADPAKLRHLLENGFKGRQAHLEIGCGKGSFAVESALANPDILFIAMEKEKNVAVAAMEKAMAQDIPNLRFIVGDAMNLPDFFSEGEISRLYLNFCDPWPKKRQAKRRLTHERFLKMYIELLTEGGEIHFKTDNLDLFNFSLDEFEKCGFLLKEVTNNLHGDGTPNILTEYEGMFAAKGIPINRCVAVRRQPDER